MAKLTNISGFPEWMPEQKLIEDQIIATIRSIYTLHGFTPLETPAVELVSTLTSKGDINKEIYTLSRLQGDESANAEAKLALHFDLTVPLARFVAQHYGNLDFPFKRYQLQKVWRGERPQEGRFREFYQFDIDIIGRDTLPLCHDAETITVIDKVFTKLAFGPHLVRLNNRKLLWGFYSALGIKGEQAQAAITAVDKLDKIGADGVRKELKANAAVTEDAAARILSLAAVRVSPSQAQHALAELKISDQIWVAGQAEVLEVLKLISPSAEKNVVLDLSIARGLDYYTGTIIETYLTGHPEFGSLCSGGRYDDLASRFINQKLPGVGVSIGLTRLMSLVFANKLIEPKAKTPSRVLVSVYNEEQRGECNAAAETIRSHGIPAEVFHTDAKLGKQIEYADRKGIPYVLFLRDGKFEVKDLQAQTQGVVELVDWCKTH